MNLINVIPGKTKIQVGEQVGILTNINIVNGGVDKIDSQLIGKIGVSYPRYRCDLEDIILFYQPDIAKYCN
jgi:hypothetical protein